MTTFLVNNQNLPKNRSINIVFGNVAVAVNGILLLELKRMTKWGEKILKMIKNKEYDEIVVHYSSVGIGRDFYKTKNDEVITYIFDFVETDKYRLSEIKPTVMKRKTITRIFSKDKIIVDPIDIVTLRQEDLTEEEWTEIDEIIRCIVINDRAEENTVKKQKHEKDKERVYKKAEEIDNV